MPTNEALTAAITDAIQNEQWEQAHQSLVTLNAGDLPPDKKLWVYDNMGFVLYRLGRITEAKSYCDMSLAIDPNHPYAHKGKGICLAAQGRTEEGIRSLLRAIQCQPSFFDAYHDLAVILLDAGDALQAKPWAQRAYQLSPTEGEGLLRVILSRISTTQPPTP